MGDQRLLLWLNWIILSSGLLHTIGWLSTNVSGQSVSPIFLCQVLGHLTHEDGTDRLF
jgi:hypothetical protein